MGVREDGAGFTLLETLLALALLGLALFLALPLLLEQPRILRRVDTHYRALAAMESTLEALRAGALPLHSAHLPELAEGIALDLDVEPAPPPGLYAVTVRATYQVGAQPRQRRLQTLVWRPGPYELEEP